MNINDLKTKYGKVVLKSVIIAGVVLLFVFVGKWYAGRTAQEFANNLRNQAILDNRPLYDNLAILRDRTQQLESQYGIQKRELNTLRNNQKGNTTIVFKNPDKKVIAQFFDNTIDGYIPSK